jgi:hypothetical protein
MVTEPSIEGFMSVKNLNFRLELLEIAEWEPVDTGGEKKGILGGMSGLDR